jgi:hypothetical protein
MNPKPMPFVIEKLNGISMITSAHGRPIAMSWKSIPASFVLPVLPSASSSPSVSVLIIK